MKPSHFETSTRARTTTVSRRYVLKRFVATAFGGLLALKAIQPPQQRDAVPPRRRDAVPRTSRREKR